MFSWLANLIGPPRMPYIPLSGEAWQACHIDGLEKGFILGLVTAALFVLATERRSRK